MGCDDVFRSPAIGDVGRAAAAFESVLATPLDLRTEGVTRLGALIALDSRAASFETAVDTAIGAGVTTDEFVALVLALAPEDGATRVVAPAPALGSALGLDVERLLETDAAVTLTASSALSAGNSLFLRDD